MKALRTSRTGTARNWKEFDPTLDPSLGRRPVGEKLGEKQMSAKCKHLDQIKITTTDTHVCEECVKLGDTWVHLRMCMSCGNVGCCDSSKNKHATKHYRHVHHPVMRSIEPGEKWIWCYIDEMIAGEVDA